MLPAEENFPKEGKTENRAGKWTGSPRARRWENIGFDVFVVTLQYTIRHDEHDCCRFKLLNFNLTLSLVTGSALFQWTRF